MEVKLAAWDRGNELSEVVSQLNAGLSEVPWGAPEHGLCHRGGPTLRRRSFSYPGSVRHQLWQGGCSVMFPASGSHAAFWRQRWL